MMSRISIFFIAGFGLSCCFISDESKACADGLVVCTPAPQNLILAQIVERGIPFHAQGLACVPLHPDEAKLKRIAPTCGFYAADICKNGCYACYQLGLDQYNCQPPH